MKVLLSNAFSCDIMIIDDHDNKIILSIGDRRNLNLPIEYINMNNFKEIKSVKELEIKCIPPPMFNSNSIK